MLKHPVSSELLMHIGDITVSFALLEMTLKELTGALIAEHQRIGQIMTAELSFKNIRALLISLYIERHGKDEDYPILRELMIRASHVEARRNQITHSIWGAGKSPNTITRIKTTAKEKYGMRFVSETFDASTLEKIVNDIKSLSEEIIRFHIHLVQTGKAINNPSVKIW